MRLTYRLSRLTYHVLGFAEHAVEGELFEGLLAAGLAFPSGSPGDLDRYLLAACGFLQPAGPKRGYLTMGNDHGTISPRGGSMERIPVSKFKATCLAVLRRVKRTGKPILVTRRGEPIAQILPPPPPERPDLWLGSMRGTGRIVGDILGPAVSEREWEALQE